MSPEVGIKRSRERGGEQARDSLPEKREHVRTITARVQGDHDSREEERFSQRGLTRFIHAHTLFRAPCRPTPLPSCHKGRDRYVTAPEMPALPFIHNPVPATVNGCRAAISPPLKGNRPQGGGPLFPLAPEPLKKPRHRYTIVLLSGNTSPSEMGDLPCRYRTS